MKVKKLGEPQRVRWLALFEGCDNFNCLHPMLGAIDPATNRDGNPIFWPDSQVYQEACLVGQITSTLGWRKPTTKNPCFNDVEEWEIWNLSANAHPIHLHAVFFEYVGRKYIVLDSKADPNGIIQPSDKAAGNGT